MDQESADQLFLINVSTHIRQICDRFNRIQLLSHNVDNIATGKKLLNYHNEILITLKSQVKSLETVINASTEIIQDMTDDLIQETREDDFVFSTSLGMLSYNGRSITKERRRMPAMIKDTTAPPKPTISTRTLIPQIHYHLHVPHIRKLEEAKPMFYWHEEALYVRLLNDVYAKVPFPDIYDSAKNYERRCSVRCKYRTKEICDKQRAEVAKLYNSQVRVCNFAHAGEKIVKIGYASRCPSRPNYGNPSTIAEDSKNVSLDDIKSMLLYGLNDLIIAAIWLDYKKEKIVFDDLTIA
jgi:hypothetical protein